MIAKIEIEIDYEIDGLLPKNFKLDEIMFLHITGNSGIITSKSIDNSEDYAVIINGYNLKKFKTTRATQPTCGNNH